MVVLVLAEIVDYVDREGSHKEGMVQEESHVGQVEDTNLEVRRMALEGMVVQEVHHDLPIHRLAEDRNVEDIVDVRMGDLEEGLVDNLVEDLGLGENLGLEWFEVGRILAVVDDVLALALVDVDVELVDSALPAVVELNPIQVIVSY